MKAMPLWMENLEDEDVEFIRKFVLASGSLKEMAEAYGVTYPTVRLRLDRLIEKIRIRESEEQDDYILLIKNLALENQLDYEGAKLLIEEYRKRRSSVKRGDEK